MGDVVDLSCITRLDLDPDRVLSAALDKLQDVVIMGFDKKGEEYFASSLASGPEVLWHLERAKKKLLEIIDNYAI